MKIFTKTLLFLTGRPRTSIGFLNFLVVLFLGDRLKHCAPNGEQAPFARSHLYNESLPVHHFTSSGRASFTDPDWQLAAAKHLSSKWELHRLHFVRIADYPSDVWDVRAYTNSLMVAIIDGAAPRRRQEAQPYLWSSPGGAIASTLPLRAINKAALGFEKASGCRLFPLTYFQVSHPNFYTSPSAPRLSHKPISTRAQVAPGAKTQNNLGSQLKPMLRTLELYKDLQMGMSSFILEVADLPGKAEPLSPPFAIYEVSSGRISIEAALVRQMGQLTDLPSGLAAFAEALFSQMSRFLLLKDTSDLAHVANVVLSAAASAVTFAIAYQVPLWFCIACPVVLGMLAPFVINGGLALLASTACSHWQLPRDECNDLWYGVFAAGMVLSLASAIPIVFLCKLPQCAHRHKV